MKILFIFSAFLGFQFLQVNSLLTKPVLYENSIDTNLVKFKGVLKRVEFESNRKIKDAPFKIVNKSNNELKVVFVKGTLLRGDFEDELKNSQFEVFLSGKFRKCNEFLIKPKTTVEFNITFKSYTIYAGSGYAVKAYIKINGENIEAISHLEIYKLAINDKNKYKNGK
jgi:hypothetical protein